MTALLVIATGERYRLYARDLILSAKKFFVPHDVILFTDDGSLFVEDDFNHVKLIIVPTEGWPKASLMRYHMFLDAESVLQRYQYLFYSDADMRFVASVSEDEILSDGITATSHPGYIGRPGEAQLETNPESTAYCSSVKNYFAGGFQGGSTLAFLTMAKKLRENIDTDLSKNIMARWFDESHLNRYLEDNPPAKILSPAFCCPDNEPTSDYYKTIWLHAGLTEVVPKLLALSKGAR